MNTKLFLFIALSTVALLSSCNQENEFEKDLATSTTENLETKAAPQANKLTAAMENVETFLKAPEKPEIEIVDSTAFADKTADNIKLEIKKDSELETRGGYLSCGNSVYGSTYGKGNTVHNGIYQNFGLNANLNGQDDIYVVEINNYTTADFLLSNTNRNLGMVLFKGYVNCSSWSCNYTFTQLVTRTTSASLYGDALYGVILSPGTYLLVVDSEPYGESNFNLQMTCASSTSGYCGLYGTDNFGSYYNGDLTPQACHWSKWNPYAYYDAQVEGSYDKWAHIERKSTSQSNQPDVLLNLKQHGNNVYRINFDFWVPSYNSGYFNIQKVLSYNNSSNEFGAQVYFYSNGSGVVKIAGNNYYFYYTQARWTRVSIYANANYGGYTAISLDGYTVANYPSAWTSTGYYGNNKIQAVDFYAHASDANFYVDNVTVSNY
jgi:hypothetical protein